LRGIHDVLEQWRGTPAGVHVKHVEPLGALSETGRLLETQAALRGVFGERVTVLATGPLALPFRAVLAESNALDYLAVDGTWSAAPGQRLLDDALLSFARASRCRRGRDRFLVSFAHIGSSGRRGRSGSEMRPRSLRAKLKGVWRRVDFNLRRL
jgi:hypothetical protein